MQDPHTGESGFEDWSINVIKLAGLLLSHGAQFVYTADDVTLTQTRPRSRTYVHAKSHSALVPVFMLPCHVNSPFALHPVHPLGSTWQAFNPSFDPKHPGMVFPLPGPGMFAAMMMKLM